MTLRRKRAAALSRLAALGGAGLFALGGTALLPLGASADGAAGRDAGAPARPPPPDIGAPPPRVQDLGAAGPSVAERLAEIRRRVQAVAVYPELARARGIEGEAEVGFEVAASGRPTRVWLERSSGSRALDRAAERAVTSAGVFPYVVGRIRVPVRFALTGGPRAGD